MKKVLYIKVSPRKERSYSLACADAFIEAYKAKNPADEVMELNLFDMELPAFDGFTIESKYNILHGKDHSEKHKAAWKAVEDVIEQFKSADKYVFAVPMWNFCIPYKLKHYIDILVQPTYTFSYDPQAGYSGLVGDKPVFISYSRGGAYQKGTGAESFDYQTTYLEMILGFIGLTDIRRVITEPTLQAGPDEAEKKKENAISEARKIAENF